jgi:hypothetical protein
MARMALLLETQCCIVSNLAHIFGVIELPPSRSAHVWVISPTHIYNGQIVRPK